MKYISLDKVKNYNEIYYFSVPNVGSKKNNFFKSHINIHITFSMCQIN